MHSYAVPTRLCNSSPCLPYFATTSLLAKALQTLVKTARTCKVPPSSHPTIYFADAYRSRRLNDRVQSRPKKRVRDNEELRKVGHIKILQVQVRKQLSGQSTRCDSPCLLKAGRYCVVENVVAHKISKVLGGVLQQLTVDVSFPFWL